MTTRTDMERLDWLEATEAECALVQATNDPQNGRIWQVHHCGSSFGEDLRHAIDAAMEGEASDEFRYLSDEDMTVSAWEDLRLTITRPPRPRAGEGRPTGMGDHARDLVKRILDDINGRRGFDCSWYDEDVQEFVVPALVEIVEDQALNSRRFRALAEHRYEWVESLEMVAFEVTKRIGTVTVETLEEVADALIERFGDG